LRSSNRATVFTLLLLMAAMNVSRAMVLCVGNDGHVAIEPVGHDHCADGTHLCEADAATHDKYLVPGEDAEGCGGCTDLPMADQIGSDPGASAAAKNLSAGMLAASSPLLIPPNDSAGVGLSATASTTFYYVPLSSIVLQV